MTTSTLPLEGVVEDSDIPLGYTVREFCQCGYTSKNLSFSVIALSSDIPRVALLIETTRTYAREMLAGVREYLAANSPWSTFIELRALDSTPPPWLSGWQGDGILTRTFSPEMAAVIADTGLPAVELRSTRLRGDRPFVGMDNRLIGQAVAEHFVNRGYRHFAVYGLSTEAFFEERVRNFAKAVEETGRPCHRLPENPEFDWEGIQGALIEHLRALPKPVGIFAANDQLGIYLLDACQRAGLSVPEEVAVVGCENEETLCQFATPELTSVRFDGRSVGRQAAAMLDRLMRGESLERETVLVAPRGIVVRQSSDDYVITDLLIARAARLIREQATTGLNVNDLCGALHVSRSTLERRMKAALKRTPKEEILRIRFREVERLLTDTDLTIETIASQSGFAHSHYLQAVFKERRGMTPGQFRKHPR